MNQNIVCLVLFLTVNYVYTSTTPHGRKSQCREASEGVGPKVCSDPVPSNLNEVAMVHKVGLSSIRDLFQKTLSGNARKINIRKYRNIEPASQEDSSPAPLSQCGQDESDRIYGGQITELDEFPWMALLVYRNRNEIKYLCGGTLINRRYVLTAAHCFDGLIKRSIGKFLYVRLGEYDTRQDKDCLNDDCADRPQNILVAGIYIHSGYSDKDPDVQDDISLIRLARRARYSVYVKPICLVDSSARFEAGHTVYVAGWGHTSPQGKSSPVKLKLSLPIFDKTECARKYGLGAKLIDKLICAGGKSGQDSCEGDSGGPLMRRRAEGAWEAVGVVSVGHENCGTYGWPGIYTSVASYDDWIRSTLQSTNV